MCGQLGIIFGTKRRRLKEIDHLTDLLLLSEKQGRHATGTAWLNRYGEHCLCKELVPAQAFVEDRKYHRVISGVGNKTTILRGHTRWQARGDALNNLNNHPIKTKVTVGTHNGTINQGRPYQPVYIKDGKEPAIRYCRVTIESAIAELQDAVEHDGGTCNGKRYHLMRGEE